MAVNGFGYLKSSAFFDISTGENGELGDRFGA